MKTAVKKAPAKKRAVPFAKVLAWVNEERRAMGRPPIKKMPKGNQFHHNRCCPIATALGKEGVTVSVSGYTRPHGIFMKPFPPHVQKFSDELADGKHKTLIGEPVAWDAR